MLVDSLDYVSRLKGLLNSITRSGFRRQCDTNAELKDGGVQCESINFEAQLNSLSTVLATFGYPFQKMLRRWREQNAFLLHLPKVKMAMELLMLLFPPLFSNGYPK